MDPMGKLNIGLLVQTFWNIKLLPIDYYLFLCVSIYRITYNCWIYCPKQFPKEFLHKYQFLSEYRDSVEHPYRET